MTDQPRVFIRWVPDYTGPDTAMTVQILESGWLRVHWSPGKVSYVSPSAVREVSGEGVIFSDQ